MCMRLGVPPYSRSPTPVAVGSDSVYPATDVSSNLHLNLEELLYLESEVLKEVSGAIGLVCFCSASSVDPYTDC